MLIVLLFYAAMHLVFGSPGILVRLLSITLAKVLDSTLTLQSFSKRWEFDLLRSVLTINSIFLWATANISSDFLAWTFQRQIL